MRWKRGHQSANVDDHRRGRGGRIPMPRGGGRQMGCGGIIFLLILSYVFKTDFFSLLNAGGAGMATSAPSQPYNPSPGVGGEDPQADLKSFVSFVLDDTEQVWNQQFSRMGKSYRAPRLNLFNDPIPSACGYAQSAMGPFYCPGDLEVYIDLGFYNDLSRRFGAPGDFAQAYVLAHEVGHHVQNLLGIERQVRQAQRQNRRLANQYSVAMELQADCFAGIWGHSASQRQLLERGDVEEGLKAAAAIGDDRIQEMSGRHANPESFTHGSSQQRVEWFRRGLKTGDVNQCDTFSG